MSASASVTSVRISSRSSPSSSVSISRAASRSPRRATSCWYASMIGLSSL